jgi:hypothetical protein
VFPSACIISKKYVCNVGLKIPIDFIRNPDIKQKIFKNMHKKQTKISVKMQIMKAII